MLRIALLVSAFLIVAPAPAGAEIGTTSQMVREFVAVGVGFWHDRNVYPCEHPIVIRADIGPEAHGATLLGHCPRMWISSGLITAAQRERWRPGIGGESVREELCTTIVHELGHTAGLEHTETGLMGTSGGAVPWACHVWRMRQDRAQRRASRRVR